MRLTAQNVIGTWALAASALSGVSAAGAATHDFGAARPQAGQAASFATQAQRTAAQAAEGLAAPPALATPVRADQANWRAAAGVEGAEGSTQAFAGRVQGLAEGGGPKAWYSAALPVPEPNTYLLMLAGLGVIGLVARRRRPH